jgi:hypothetical protein
VVLVSTRAFVGSACLLAKNMTKTDLLNSRMLERLPSHIPGRAGGQHSRQGVQEGNILGTLALPVARLLPWCLRSSSSKPLEGSASEDHVSPIPTYGSGPTMLHADPDVLRTNDMLPLRQQQTGPR